MAAGLGFKTFTTGEVLTAADVNGYLMQGVLVFATEAARNSAITSPQEGQFAFTKDTNSLWYYTGSAWAASGATGDIEGVTAGTGISGGGTSGTVTITNDMATTITASGDIVVGTGSGTYDNLPIGTTGQILTADTTVSPYKVKWAAPAAGGKVLQVIEGTYNTAVSNSTTTYADTGLTATITPSSASSKVLVFVNHNGFYMAQPASGSNSGRIKLYRGATEISSADYGYATTQFYAGSCVQSILDTPATTSATTYKTQFISVENKASITLQSDNRNRSSIILMEIGA